MDEKEPDTGAQNSLFIGDIKDVDDNVIQPFQLDETNLRGRMVRIGSVLDDIIQAHDYPKHVSHLVAETAILSALLSSMLKYDGVFTLQAQGDGPINTIVADMTTSGDLRACANFDPERLAHSIEQLAAMKSSENAQNHLAQLLGKGYLAFTVDQGASEDRYQGIVELKGSSMIDCVQHYFAQSEQIGTGIKIAVGQRDGKWRAAGIMIQRMPEEGGDQSFSNIEEDDWRRTMVFLDSSTENEMLDPALHSHILLTRLFHEEGVRVYEPHAIKKACRCNTEKVETVLLSLSDDDREYLKKDGKISVRCEFCSKEFLFDPKTFTRKLKASDDTQSQQT